MDAKEDSLATTLQELALVDDTNTTFTEIEKRDHLTFFRTCVVSKEMGTLIDRLKSTVALRCEVLQKDSTDFLESFPFYFAEPTLVSIWSQIYMQTTSSNSK